MPVQLDDPGLFAAPPSAHLVLDACLVVVHANPAHLGLIGLMGLQRINGAN